MVSFTRHSGIQALVPAFQEAERLNKPIRVLTSFYMNITEAKALRTLMQFRNIEIKIYEPIKKNQAFHPKAYLFTRETDLHSAIIGSSNLSKSALTNGLEWNVRIPHSPLTSLVSQAQTLFTNLWTSDEAITCTTEILEQYEHIQGAQANTFLVGTRGITAYEQPALGMVYKLVAREIDGELAPVIKVSSSKAKTTTPHIKEAYRIVDPETNKFKGDYITLLDEDPSQLDFVDLIDVRDPSFRNRIENFKVERLLAPIFKDGELVYTVPTIEESRQFHEQQIGRLWDH
ncbi:hypothetical protein CEK62_19785 [Alcanivorax sp. N3-2A]|nr:hypothetical protein CEK62_19785 [Alcanivorax sp. N3-2A]